MKDYLFTKTDLTEQFLFDNQIDITAEDIVEKLLPILTVTIKGGERHYNLKQLHRVIENSEGLNRFDLSKFHDDRLMPLESDSPIALLSKYDIVCKSCAMKLPLWIETLNKIGRSFDEFLLQDIYKLTISFGNGEELELYSLSDKNLKDFFEQFKKDNEIKCRAYCVKEKCTLAVAKERLLFSQSMLDDKIYPDRFDKSYNSYQRDKYAC